MARPIKWKVWKENPLKAVEDNQNIFEEYFLKKRVCIANTPKQRNLFNLWIKKRYLEHNPKKDESLVSYFRKSKHGKEHESRRWEKIAIANLNFFYDFAKGERVYFDKYEKKFLSLSLLNHRDQISKKGGKIFGKIRITLLDMVMIRLDRINRDLEKWLNPDEKLIQDTLDLIEDPNIKEAILNSTSIEKGNLKAQSFGASKLSEIIKDIEKGKNRYRSQLGEAYQYLPEDMKESFYHIIYWMPLTLVIKILELYLPFSMGGKLIRTKVYDMLDKMRNPDHDLPSLSPKEEKIIKEICNLYMKYGKLKSMF